MIQIILGRDDIKVTSTKARKSSSQLMHDFACTQASDILNPVLRERVRYLKESEGGTAEMCELVEEYAEKKAMRKQLEIAKELIETTDLSLEHIARVVKLPLDTVKELAQGRTA